MKNGYILGNSADRMDWRDYQTRLHRIASARRRTRLFRLYAVTLFFLILLGFGINESKNLLSNIYSRLCDPETHVRTDTVAQQMLPKEKIFDKKDIQEILEGVTLINLPQRNFDISHEGHNYRITTTLDMTLQNFMIKNLTTSNVRHIGIVAMEPSTGRILSMTGFDKTNSSANPCLDSIFPAASIFKIVTAAAAVEKSRFSQESTVSFTGGKYTLYKSQLSEKHTKYSNNMTLLDSFAQSVNPVFGKIGANSLGKFTLDQYASAFGFNKKIDFEVPVNPSTITIEDNPFHLAEVASGFNRTTIISPLHGALIGSAVLNKGVMLEPSLIDTVQDDKGNVVYKRKIEQMSQVISPKASEILTTMMEATVDSGTGRKAFKNYQKDSILSKLDIGGKTGSINNDTHETHYDWFVGFASDRTSGKKIVVSVVVAHEKFIGTRSGQYARMLMKQYFTEYFASSAKKQDATKL